MKLVVGGLNHLEQHLAVGDVDGSTAQLLVERGVVQQVEVHQHEQACRLEIGIERQNGAQLVERVAVQAFRVVYVFYYFHCVYYQFTTVAL